jgi:uncharacterized protein YceK
LKNIALLLITLTLFSGCAKIHNSQFAKSSGELKISGERLEEFSNENISMFTLTFENIGEKWLTIEDLNISFGDEVDSAIKTVKGEDFITYLKAIQLRNSIDRHNKNLLIGTVIGVGAIVAGSSNSQATKNIGAGISLGGLGTGVYGDISSYRDSLERAGGYPENHILAGKFRVPPKLFVKKFTVISGHSEEIGKTGVLRISYRENGRKMEAILELE